MRRRKETVEEKLRYREPMLVTKMLVFSDDNAYPVCPRCYIWFEVDYSYCCPFCGQLLRWRGYSRLKPTYV